MPSMRNGGMAMQAERGRGLGAKSGAGAAGQPKKKVDFRKLWPTIWALVKPRLWLIILGLVLVAIKTVAGLTLPFLSKYLLDGVLATLHVGDGRPFRGNGFASCEQTSGIVLPGLYDLELAGAITVFEVLAHLFKG